MSINIVGTIPAEPGWRIAYMDGCPPVPQLPGVAEPRLVVKPVIGWATVERLEADLDNDYRVSADEPPPGWRFREVLPMVVDGDVVGVPGRRLYTILEPGEIAGDDVVEYLTLGGGA